jgi:rare lipoprotein A (peptidoglycan hydrolase)
MNRVTPFFWAIAIVIALGLGIIIGARVIAGIAEHEAKAMQAKLDEAVADRDEAQAELAQNQATVISWDCLASYYTERSSGAIQANGTRFDEEALTAAHRTLLFGTILIIENLDNGKLSPVQIQDRGPAEWTGRSLDVSLAVARRLGIVERGEANLRCYLMVDGRPSRGN